MAVSLILLKSYKHQSDARGVMPCRHKIPEIHGNNFAANAYIKNNFVTFAA